METSDAMHQNTAPNTTTMHNRKYVSADGYFEAVYSYDGKLLNEGVADIDMGTYNYAQSTRKSSNSKNNIIIKALDKLYSYAGHGLKDMATYEIYRNSKKDLKEHLNSISKKYIKQYGRIESK